MPELSLLERSLINRFQGGFPLAGRPFASVAEQLGSDEQGVITTIRDLLDRGWLSRFGPLYNAERMGGGLILAAMEVPESDFERVTELLNQIPEVAHNYRRDHRLNMWFVLATDTPKGIDDAVKAIEQASGLTVYAFPKEQEYYLGLWFELGEDGGFRTRSLPSTPYGPPATLDDLDRRIVTVTQAGLPLTPEPCETVAESAGCEPGEVVARMEGMMRSGVIRRIGLVPNHYKLGFRGNGMTVWNVPDEQLDAVGERVGALDYVSHCYARPRRLPQWPYNLFAMVHGKDRAQVSERVEEMSRLLEGEIIGHDVLFSSAVLKKTGMRLPV